MFTFPCPQCQKRLRAEDHHVGQKATCGKCHAPLIVPPPPTAILLPEAHTRRHRPDTRRDLWIVLVIVGAFLLAIILWIVYQEHLRQESIREGGKLLLAPYRVGK